MPQHERIFPRLDYQPTNTQERIVPRPGYKAPTLHSRMLPTGSMVKTIEAEWCPVCLGREISERMKSGRPVWHCNTCENEW